jgi:aspartokinase
MGDNFLVMKFGGTSVGTSQAMAQAVQIVDSTRASWSGIIPLPMTARRVFRKY